VDAEQEVRLAHELARVDARLALAEHVGERDLRAEVQVDQLGREAEAAVVRLEAAEKAEVEVAENVAERLLDRLRGEALERHLSL